MVFLPEACDYIAGNKVQSVAMAESLDGPLVEQYKSLAKSFGVWLSLGGLHIRVNFSISFFFVLYMLFQKSTCVFFF